MDRCMRGIATVAVAAIALLAPSSASATGEWDHLVAPESICPGQSDVAAGATAQEQAMVCLHRYARAQSGLPGLHIAKQLKASAMRKAKDIKHCQSFSHQACGRDAFYWVERMKFFRGRSGAGENLAMGSGDAGSPRAMFTSLLESEGHREVMLSPTFESFGINMLQTGFRGYSGVQIWVVHFGYRR
jgi:uncharacterized protein YkwD